MLINPLGNPGNRPKFNPDLAKNIKDWVKEVAHPEEETTIMITQLYCTEPGCAPVETVIALLGAGKAPVQYKIFKPLETVTFEDVAGAIEAGLLSKGESTPIQPLQLLRKPPTELE